MPENFTQLAIGTTVRTRVGLEFVIKTIYQTNEDRTIYTAYGRYDPTHGPTIVYSYEITSVITA